MNVFEFVFGIVLLCVIGGIATTYLRTQHKRLSARDDGTSARLREELTMLKDRMAVLERITVEKENSLERQIEQLRDR
jgi:Na+/glutamate symporter